MKTLQQKKTELKNEYLFFGIDNIKEQIYIELYIRQKGNEKEYQEKAFKAFIDSFFPGEYKAKVKNTKHV